MTIPTSKYDFRQYSFDGRRCIRAIFLDPCSLRSEIPRLELSTPGTTSHPSLANKSNPFTDYHLARRSLSLTAQTLVNTLL